MVKATPQLALALYKQMQRDDVIFEEKFDKDNNMTVVFYYRNGVRLVIKTDMNFADFYEAVRDVTA